MPRSLGKNRLMSVDVDMVQGGVFECHFVVLRKFAILGAIAGHYCEVSCCNAGPRWPPCIQLESGVSIFTWNILEPVDVHVRDFT